MAELNELTINGSNYTFEDDVARGLATEEANRAKEAEGNKVDKVAGKGLSTNDYTDAEKAKLAGLENYDDTQVRQLIAQTNANFANYYTKAESYSATEVDTLLRTQRQGQFVVVSTLPTPSADTMFKIYLVPSTNPETSNIKDEFVTLESNGTYSWEQIGTTAVDLSGYSTTEEMNAAIASALGQYYTKTEIDALVQSINTAVGQKASQADLTAETARARQAEQDLQTGKQAVITDLASIAIGSGISSDDTYTAARTVAIPNFILLTGATVKVLFTTPVNSEDTTLNVNSTGAKPLYILGQQLPAGVIKAQTYADVVYDGTAWNIVNVFRPDASFDPAALLVDMGLPSGVKWAARDIDLTKPGGFCETPFIYEKSFFSWGNIDGHNLSSTSAFAYDWGGVNGAEPWYDGQVYGSTPGNTLTGNIAVGEDFDAARANLGAPWRMPTSAEYAELLANIIYIDANGDEVDTTKADKRVSVNGVMGLYMESTINGARLFFSCSGHGSGRSWSSRGSNGHYWSSTWNSARYARNLYFSSGGVNPQNNYGRYYGFALRPVQ